MQILQLSYLGIRWVAEHYPMWGPFSGPHWAHEHNHVRPIKKWYYWPTWDIRGSAVWEAFACYNESTLDRNSWVINLDSVTILWLVRFDDWFDFFGPFIKNLASMSFPKIPAIFSRGQNQRWPTTPFWKIKFWTRAPITLYKYIFSINSITRIPNQILIWRLDFIFIQNSKMAAIR